LQQLATKREASKTEVLRHAISLEDQIDKEIREGARILVEKEGTFWELEINP
jgi:hypothetical protein